jgi:hypothetical protein
LRDGICIRVQQPTPDVVWGRSVAHNRALARRVVGRAHRDQGVRMRKWVWLLWASWMPWSSSLAAELTATEMRWLKGVAPVVAFAKQTQLPLDIVVQPQDEPGAAPLALGFVDGRCKLVLSMRGNPEAQATLDRIEPDLLDAALQLMAAHELGHCRRYLDGSWFHLPAGFVAREPASLSADDRQAYANMRSMRREEGYADLVGLAWAQKHHRGQYERLHRLLLTERSKDLIAGSHHDTLAWLQLARDGAVFTQPSIFEAAAALWPRGLAAGDP